VTAGRYFAVTRAHGTPPYDTPAQIAAAPADQRQSFDSVLTAAYGIAPQPILGHAGLAASPRLAATTAPAGLERRLAVGATVIRI
jgi:hypothetical protein